MHLGRYNSKGVRRLKTEHLNSYIFPNNVQALIIVLKRLDILINRIITNENAEVYHRSDLNFYEIDSGDQV